MFFRRISAKCLGGLHRISFARHGFMMVLAVFLIFGAPQSAYGSKAKGLEALIKLLAGGEAVRRGTTEMGQWSEEREYAESIEASLKRQGCVVRGAGVYSCLFKTDAGYWADIFSKPDVFIVVDIEGQGSFLVPRIHNSYSGYQILEHVVAGRTSPGDRIVVRVYDDDSGGDAVWNTIAQTSIDYEFTAGVCAKGILVKGQADGSLRVLDQSIVIDPPDYIASVLFEVPSSDDGKWAMVAQLIDSSGDPVGEMQFRSTWQSNSTLGRTGWIAFWLTVGAGFLAWYCRDLFGRKPA